MSDHAVLAPPSPAGPALISDIKVSGHLMSLDTGLFCIVQSRAGRVPQDASGLPGVRISALPGARDSVAISSFRQDGWLGGQAEAALVRVMNGPAQILVTIYQCPAHGSEAAPKLQVIRLGPDLAPAAVPETGPQPDNPFPPAVLADSAEMVAHVQGRGDVAGELGGWIGVPGSRLALEGFCIRPQAVLSPAEVEYQAILGRSWTSPWVSDGTFCGSRGMALPLLGLRVRLRGRAADAFVCGYAATFVDGSSTGPVPAGEPCQAESLAPLEAFQLLITPRAAATPSR